MEKKDARQLNREDLYTLRKRIVRRRRNGRTNHDVAKIEGVHPTYVSKIWQLYLKGGIESLKPKARGRRAGQKRRLTADQETTIRDLLIERNPSHYNLGYRLWTREAVGAVVWKELRIELPLRTICDYLSRWGYAARMPQTKATGQTREKVLRWLNRNYSKIKEKAKQENGEVIWCDDTGVHDAVDYVEGFFENMIAVPKPIDDSKINLISTISWQGKTSFMLYRGKPTTHIFILFIDRLIHDTKRKLHIIMHNHRTHQYWKKGWEKRLEIYFLPSDLPELSEE